MGLFSVLLTVVLSSFATTNQADHRETLFCQNKGFIAIQIENYPNHPALTCEQVVPAFEQALINVQAISPVPLEGPLLVLHNQTLTRGGTYSWVTTTIHMELESIDKIHDKILFFYHEMGHKIYFEYLAQVSGEISDKQPEFKKYIEALKACAVHTPDESCDLTQAKDQVIQASKTFSKEFDQFIYIDNAYNELFADVVASLAAQEQDAIATVLGPCTTSEPSCEYRKFSKNTIDMFAGTNNYSRLSPLRRDLWEGWIAPRLENPKQLLNDLATEFSQESSTNFKEDYKLNEALFALKQIQRLRERLSLPLTESPSYLLIKGTY